MNFAEFVLNRFVPEYVANRRHAGRAHLQAILKHVLPPEQVVRAFPASPGAVKAKLKEIQGWPYMASLRLSEVSAERIQLLTSTALNRGYSVQTVTHFRSVIRAIFSYAAKTGCYTGTNPATLITLPAMARKEAHTLTLTQLKQAMQRMRYPEKNIALFSLLTGMNISEICGLQWRYLNLSNDTDLVDEERIPSRTIAVRMQSYRGEVWNVIGSRKRFVPAPELLCSILRDLKRRRDFTEPQDFVLVSQRGTPICQENIAARRLKPIGKALDLPWLSWNVFHRSRISLRSQYGEHWHRELERILPLNRAVVYYPLGVPVTGQSQTTTGRR